MYLQIKCTRDFLYSGMQGTHIGTTLYIVAQIVWMVFWVSYKLGEQSIGISFLEGFGGGKSRLLLHSEYMYFSQSELYPYLGYELGLWASTDFLVKIAEPFTQYKWS